MPGFSAKTRITDQIYRVFQGRDHISCVNNFDFKGHMEPTCLEKYFHSCLCFKKHVGFILISFLMKEAVFQNATRHITEKGFV